MESRIGHYLSKNIRYTLSYTWMLCLQPFIYILGFFHGVYNPKDEMPKRIFADEIDRINNEKTQEKLKMQKNGCTDFLPATDVSVWLRTCKKETIQPIKGKVSGSLPGWLRGSLYRNGPGSIEMGEYTFNHLFDCPALVHKFCIGEGEVIYQCRFVQTEAYRKGTATGRIVLTEFGTRAVPDPCKTIFHKFSSYFQPLEMSDNCMITVYPINDQLYTFGETPVIHRIDPDTLETIKPVDLTKYVAIAHHTSHPHVERDGTVYNVGLNLCPKGPRYAIMHFPNSKRDIRSNCDDPFKEGRLVGGAACRWPLHPGYMHTFGITPSYFIIVEQPLSVSLPARVRLQFTNQPFYNVLKWYPQYPTVFHVIWRASGATVATYRAEPFFYLHLINQYQEADRLVVDICAYKDPSMIDCMLIEALKTAKQDPKYSNMFRGRPVRFVLPLSTPGVWVTPEFLCDMGCETPQVNYPLYSGQPYRYFYAITSDVDLDKPGNLVKVDVINKTKKIWGEMDTFPSEPIFVASPDAKSEDDGVVVSMLLWTTDVTKVALVVLDAASFTEISRTVFKADSPVPKSLHGWFLSYKQTSQES